MNIFKSKMTPAELAEIVGYQPQTINKWIKKFGWKTTQLRGVKGGKAHVIHMSAEVRQFMLSTRNLRKQGLALTHAAENDNVYQQDDGNTAQQLTHVFSQMSDAEQTRFLALIMREGITGVLKRLGIND